MCANLYAYIFGDEYHNNYFMNVLMCESSGTTHFFLLLLKICEDPDVRTYSKHKSYRAKMTKEIYEICRISSMHKAKIRGSL